MSYQYNICKGRACALHLTPEYKAGQLALPRATNPFDFFDEYEKHYAWDIGNQKQVLHDYQKEAIVNCGENIVNGAIMYTGVLR